MARPCSIIARYLVITPCDKVGGAALLVALFVISVLLALLYASLPVTYLLSI